MKVKTTNPKIEYALSDFAIGGDDFGRTFKQ
jgi:hypothetical protein